MKSKLALIAALCALAFPMTFAGGETKPAAAAVSPGNEAASVEERVIEVDISVTLDHYRKIRALLLEEEFDRLFTETAKGEEKASLEAQIRSTRLRDYAEKLRVRALEYGAMLKKLRDDRRANSSSGK
jgi:hypothetical protein